MWLFIFQLFKIKKKPSISLVSDLSDFIRDKSNEKSEHIDHNTYTEQYPPEENIHFFNAMTIFDIHLGKITAKIIRNVKQKSQNFVM